MPEQIKCVGLDVCPYCQGTDLRIEDVRHEFTEDTYPRDLVCQDMECENCGRRWTVEHRPVCYFEYSPDGDFLDRPRSLEPLRELPDSGPPGTDLRSEKGDRAK